MGKIERLSFVQGLENVAIGRTTHEILISSIYLKTKVDILNRDWTDRTVFRLSYILIGIADEQ